MPIYAYRCGACGHERDVLQKLSDPVLTVCLACGAAAFAKQLTAAGFQLKGSGWYVTDFRDGGKKAGEAGKAADGKADASGDKGVVPTGEAKTGEAAAPSPTAPSGSSASVAASSSASSATASAPASAPASTAGGAGSGS